MTTFIERKTFTAGGADQACEKYINDTNKVHTSRRIVSVQEVGKNYLNAEALMNSNPVSVEYLIVWEVH